MLLPVVAEFSKELFDCKRRPIVGPFLENDDDGFSTNYILLNIVGSH